MVIAGLLVVVVARLHRNKSVSHSLVTGVGFSGRPHSQSELFDGLGV